MAVTIYAHKRKKVSQKVFNIELKKSYIKMISFTNYFDIKTNFFQL